MSLDDTKQKELVDLYYTEGVRTMSFSVISGR